MMVNGQQVSCNLDGMSVPCSMAMGMMQSGSAIPAALADTNISRALGSNTSD